MIDQTRIRDEAERLQPLAHEVVGRYPFEVDELTHLATHSNVMYRVVSSNGRQMVLRISTPGANSRANIEYEVDWLSAINEETDLDVVSPIPTSSGRTIVDAADPDTGEERWSVLFSWVPGAPMGEGTGSFGYRLMGSMSAQLQEHGRRWLPEDPTELRHWNQVFYYDPELDPVVLFDTDYDHLVSPEQRRLIEKAIPMASEVVKTTWRTGRLQIVHGDLHEWNVHLVSTRLYAFDFEDVMAATPAQDVSISLYSSRSSGRSDEIRAAFREGFEAYGEWPIESAEQLDGHHAARQIMLMNYALKALPDQESSDYLESVTPWLERYVATYA